MSNSAGIIGNFSDLSELANNLQTFRKESNYLEITVKAVLFFASHLPEHESSKEAMGMLLSGNLKPFQKKASE